MSTWMRPSFDRDAAGSGQCVAVPTPAAGITLYHAYLFDLDGTIYLGDALLPGAAETIAALRQAGRRTIFLSNNPTRTRQQVAAKLTDLGIPTPAEDQDQGFPPRDYFAALHPDMANIVDTKMSRDIAPQAAQWTGLRPSTAVAVANVDAHVTVPVTGSTAPGTMVMIMGTSTCHVMLGEKLAEVPGMCGVVQGGVVPGLFGYEAGQSGVGDIFAWFVDHGVPPEYHEEARRRGVGLHSLLEKEAARLKPAQSGLLALDWWNGNRSTLVDVELSGLLIEATAFGTREIIDTLEHSGVPVQELVAAGGLPERNRLLMQIYADVTNREIGIVRSSQAPAVGSAMHAAVAAGVEAGGYPDIATAAWHMGGRREETYRPIPRNVHVYDRLYAEYKTLYGYFGRGQNDVMKRLRAMRRDALAPQEQVVEEQLQERALPDAVEQQALEH